MLAEQLVAIFRQMIIENALNIYTDGSSLSRPRTGGIGIRFIFVDSTGQEEIQDFEYPGHMNATNNQMELYACITALKEARGHDRFSSIRKIVVHTDSRYVVDNYRRAMFDWLNRKWTGRDGRPVLNAGLWKDLLKLIKKIGRRVEFHWVKGHSRDQHNRAVDKLAKKSALTAVNKPISIVSVRRKKTLKSVQIGSVEAHGQRISLRVITSEYLNVQKTNKYKYEVISKRSKYFGNVDIAFSEEPLRAGHRYVVRMNRSANNPRILRVIHEIN